MSASFASLGCPLRFFLENERMNSSWLPFMSMLALDGQAHVGFRKNRARQCNMQEGVVSGSG
ncbi:MAG: hypothetical protein OJF52_003176 [Nitrospira sp.]|nr:MAG: hypothetical protein OJF52_003176 [Nitrospira sp.]